MPMALRKCEGCKKEIVWAVTADGKRVPLDPEPHVYMIEGQGEAGYRARRVNGNAEKAVGQAMVSHFATCSHAHLFRRQEQGTGKQADR